MGYGLGTSYQVLGIRSNEARDTNFGFPIWNLKEYRIKRIEINRTLNFIK